MAAKSTDRGRGEKLYDQHEENTKSQNAQQRLYLFQFGNMPEYQIPIGCYLVQTDDGKNILIDTDLQELLQEKESDSEYR